MDGSRSAKFLGKACLFPRVSDSEAMQKRVKVIFRRRFGVLHPEKYDGSWRLGEALAGMYLVQMTEVCVEQGRRGPLITTARLEASRKNKKILPCT